MFGNASGGRPPRCKRGDVVEVRGAGEILATLDAQGTLDGLPFMPEMAKHCGQTFRVQRRADKLLLDRYYYIAHMKDTVFLEDLRCDGGAHGGCQLGCLMFWKTAWLKPTDAVGPFEKRPHEESALRTTQDGRFFCQATELVNATVRLPWWDLRQYVRDLAYREVGFRQLVRVLGLAVYNKLRRLCGRDPCGVLRGSQKQTPATTLDLQSGDLVEVKSAAEIVATLDAEGKNRGLGFAPEMLPHCGRRYRVARPVENIVVEASGEMAHLSNTVILAGVTCQGISARCCPRLCYHLWREAWLKRVPDARCAGV